MSIHRSKLLLVDDDALLIQIMSQMLSDFPNQRFAMSGEAALALAYEAPPDLILLDANLPGMTGFDVCEQLKSSPALAHVPVLFVTSHDAPALAADARKLGAAGYITKPLVAAQLREQVLAQLQAL